MYNVDMGRSHRLFWLFLVSIVVIAATTLWFNRNVGYRKGVSAEFDKAVANAKSLYRKRALEGMDMSNGPCLTNDLMPGWVVDIVHSPRQPADDLPENQCPAYLEGRASHFVELDTSGNLVRVK